jgi:ribose 5-phosphate isomerase B
MDSNNKQIFIGADHAGYEAKNELKKYLEELGFSVEDLGNKILDEQDDYPDFIIPVAKAVAENAGSRGVVIGGSGQGEAMAANKVQGIRAAVVYDEYSAKMSREHNDANVASFGARVTNIEKIKELTKLWLNTPFSQEERHIRRIEKLNKS